MSLAQPDVIKAPSRDGLSDASLFAAIFAISAFAYCLSLWIGERQGLASNLFAFVGDATCGWSWLLTRTLFRRDDPRPIWPLSVVLLLVATGGVLLMIPAETQGWALMAARVETLLSSCLLLLALIEPLRGLRADTPRSERAFRLIFTAGYGALLLVAVIWASGAAAQWIKAACALLAVAGMAAATLYRHRHPLPLTTRPRRAASAHDVALGARLLELVTKEKLFTDSELKLADLARRLGEPDYRVTQSLTRALGFRNINHMLNHFRLAAAKSQLADPDCDLPVLTIALDCGFGSIGPFNRAFKAEMGVTPTQYREARRAQA